jgi:hypothetical protein
VAQTIDYSNAFDFFFQANFFFLMSTAKPAINSHPGDPTLLAVLSKTNRGKKGKFEEKNVSWKEKPCPRIPVL